MPRNRSFSDGDDNGQPLSLGSGFCLGDGKLASNIHVIAGATSGYAKLVGENTKYDIEGIAALRLWPRSQGNVEISRGPLSLISHTHTHRIGPAGLYLQPFLDPQHLVLR